MRPGRPVLALAAMPLVTVALLGFELPGAAPLWIAPQVEHALAASGLAGETLAAVGFHEPSLMFLAGSGTVLAATGAEGARALASGAAAVAAVARPDLASFGSEAARLGLRLEGWQAVQGFNYSRGGGRS